MKGIKGTEGIIGTSIFHSGSKGLSEVQYKLETLMRPENSQPSKTSLIVSTKTMDVVSVVTILFSILWTFTFFLGGKPAIGLVLVSLAVSYAIIYFYFLRKRSLLFSGQLLLGLLLVGVTISNFFTGGLGGSNDVAFVVIPFLSLFLLGTWGLVWVCVCVLDISVFFALANTGYEFPQVIPSVDLWLDSSLTMFSSIVLISTIAYFYERARIKSEKEILEAKEIAEVASKAKSRFLANMSHELRTPLNAVIGLTEMTLGDELEYKQRKNLEAVKASAKQLLLLVEDVLDISCIESGSMSIRQEPFSPTELFADLINPFVQRAEDFPFDFQVALDHGLPEDIMGDSLRIRQVVTNLVDNAFKFTENGSVKLAVFWQDGLLRIEVADTGIGISPSIQQQIFRPFSKPELLLSRQTNGSGLGLALCKELVTLMNGQIHLSSTPGEGSVFAVTIPAPKVSRPKSGRKYRVLAAEDDRIGQELLKTLLGNSDYEVCVVSNGQEAVDELECSEYDLVLMDIQMPGMDGMEATRIIRRRSSGNERIPILALTAHALDEEKRKCFEAGMDDFIAKPIEPDTLLTIIGNWISKSHSN